MSDQLELAFVGCGVIAQFHLEGIRQVDAPIRITAAIDPNRDSAERIAAQTGAAVYASLTDALDAGGFDAVDIMIPHHLHESAALEAFAAGKHVMLEKPMATTLDATKRIMAAAADAATVFMVAENAQYWPEIVRAKELIDAGVIGAVFTAQASFPQQYADPWFPAEGSWRDELSKMGGGVIIDGGAHWIRPLRMWLGEIDEVVAVTGRVVEEAEGETLGIAIFRFQSGVVAGFNAVTRRGPLYAAPYWRITGESGELAVEGDLDGNRLVHVSEEHPAGDVVLETRGWADSFGPELADFASAVLEGMPLVAGPEYSLGELRTALAIYRSADSGRWEKVWD